jgi:signal transduction histidine kinase
MEEARARLQQQLFEAQKMEDLRGIASDFNDLLTVMLGSASLARYRLASEDPLQEPMRTIEQSAQRAAVLARRLAGFARPGPQQVMAATTDLRETVVKQGKILEYHGQTFDSMERRLRRLEEKAVQRRERATEDEPESETESPILN